MQQTGANCGAKKSAARLAAALLPIRSKGHKRSPLHKVSQKFCGRLKSQPPRYQYLDWSKAVANRLTALAGFPSSWNAILRLKHGHSVKETVGQFSVQPSKRTAQVGANQWEFAAAFPSDTTLGLS